MIMKTEATQHSNVLDGLTVVARNGEPMVLDVELAERLGFRVLDRSIMSPPPAARKLKTFRVSIHVEDAIPERADRLTAHAGPGALGVSCASMLRAAMLRGLDAFEADYGLPSIAAERTAAEKRAKPLATARRKRGQKA
jgi:hypothetical protein